MARTELPNGVILPAEYSDDWYEDMTSNLTKLDDVIGSDSEKLNANGLYFLRMYSAALTDSGTGNFSDLNSSYKIKTGDLVLDSGRKLYQIVSIDSANETFNVGNSLFKVTAESDLAAVATSGDYGDLDNKPDLNPYDQHLANTDIHVTAADKQKWNNGVSQAYVLRYANTSVTPSSTIAYSVLNNTDNIKAGDSVIDSAGQVFLIASVDSANQTVTVSAVLLTLAIDANVMHLSGNETAGGFKTFDRYIQCNGGYIGTEFSNNARTEFILRSNRDTSGQSGVCISKFRQNRAQGSMSGTDTVQVSFDVLENSVRSNRSWYLNWLDWENDAPKTVEVRSFCEKVDYKLTHINALNPGALSLPNLSSGLDISGYITVPNTHNTYTPPVNGWISIILKSSSGACACFIYQGDFASSQYSATSLPNESEPCVMCCLPVVGKTAVSIDTKGSNAYVLSAKFYPCLGNV